MVRVLKGGLKTEGFKSELRRFKTKGFEVKREDLKQRVSLAKGSI